LLLGRDRFGIKPLYFHRTPRRLVFASELRAVLASGLVPATLDETSVWHYVGYQTTPTPRTLIQDIRMLEPGHVLEVTAAGAVSDRRYWDLGHAASRQAIPKSLAAAQARTGELLTEAVKSHLVSDVPVGVFLSGGLDSSALLSALHASGTKAQTFTIALDEADLDESAAAAAVARQFGADHTEIRLRAGDLVDSLPHILDAMDHPSGDGVNTFIVAQAVRERGLKVALSGLGGDEVFGGYASFRRLAKLAGPAPMLRSAPLQIRRAAASAVRMTGRGSVASEKAAAVLESQGSIAEMWPITRQLFSAAARSELLSDRVPRAGDAYTAMLSRALSEDVAMEVFGQVSVAETRAYMHDVLLRDTDQMSMSHGLEVRVPMLDHRLAAYVVAVPDRWKAAGRLPKPLLTGCLELPLPRSVSAAPKRGFVLPFDAWMRGALRAFCERQLGEQGLEGRGLLRPGEARRLWSGFLERRPGITWGRVWTLVALNAWLERRSL
jgi:asparagine synthase (glutamine-hydrolysing)